MKCEPELMTFLYLPDGIPENIYLTPYPLDTMLLISFRVFFVRFNNDEAEIFAIDFSYLASLCSLHCISKLERESWNSYLDMPPISPYNNSKISKTAC